MQIEFLCGCKTGNVESRENLLTMDLVQIDDEGMLICTTHHQRRKGWRSIPSSDNHPGVKFPYLSMTPAEREGRILFKDPFPLFRGLNINYAGNDRRDNRDPEVIGVSMIQESEYSKLPLTQIYDRAKFG